MNDILRIRSKNELWNDFIVEGTKTGLSREQIKDNLIEAVRKEVFDQMVWRLKVDDLQNAPQTPKNIEIVKNITIQTQKKWRSLIRECDSHLQTLHLISEQDLQKIWPMGDDVDGDHVDILPEEEEEEPDEDPEIRDSNGEWLINETTLEEEIDDAVDEMTAEWPELSKEENSDAAVCEGVSDSADEPVVEERGAEEGADHSSTGNDVAPRKVVSVC